VVERIGPLVGLVSTTGEPLGWPGVYGALVGGLWGLSDGLRVEFAGDTLGVPGVYGAFVGPFVAFCGLADGLGVGAAGERLGVPGV